VRPVGSYCTDISRCTVYKTLKLLETFNYFSEDPGFRRGGDCTGWNSSWFFLRLFRFCFSTSYRDASCSASFPHIYSASRCKTVLAVDSNSLHGAEPLRNLEILSYSRNSPLMEPESWLPHPQVPATCPYPDLDQYNPPGQPTRGVPSVWGLGTVLTTPRHKTLPLRNVHQLLTVSLNKLSRTYARTHPAHHNKYNTNCCY
jgi:hypothetical protein